MSDEAQISELELSELYIELERLKVSVQLWQADALRYCQNAADARSLAIEECAMVADMAAKKYELSLEPEIAEEIAAAIRALKDKQ